MHSWLYHFYVFILPQELCFDKKMWMRGWKRYCVCHLVLGIPSLLQVLMWFLKSADLFLIQSKLICPLLYLLVSRHINNPPHPLSPAGWKDGPENPPQFDSSRVGHVGRAGWLRCSGSLRPTSVVLSHLPTKREGELHSEGPEGGMSRSAGENPRICRVVRLNESHHHGGSLCQELPQANNVACGGAD